MNPAGFIGGSSFGAPAAAWSPVLHAGPFHFPVVRLTVTFRTLDLKLP